MQKVLGIISLIVFTISVIIGFREPLSLVFLAMVLIIPLRFIDTIGGFFASSLILIGSIFVLLYVNSMTPLWGERYEQNKALSEIREKESKKRLENRNKISDVQGRVKSHLKDPSSAKFSGEYVSGNGRVCGFVNAKNSYGAYSGSQRYLYSSGVAFIDDGSNHFNDLWVGACE